MSELRIPVRDTYSEATNLDDFYSNGNQYNGPRLLRIDWVETSGYPEMAGKVYNVPHRKSCAYDAYSIRMPNRYKDSGRDDPIIHELTHFLQHNTIAEDSRYIAYDGTNYEAYLLQRVELEAHAVQLLYIQRSNPTRFSKHLSLQEQELVNRAFVQVSGGRALNATLEALRLCKARELI